MRARGIAALTRINHAHIAYLHIRGLRGRTAHKRRGNQGSPCLLRITTPSFRARCARKGKCSLPVAARLPQRVSKTNSTP